MDFDKISNDLHEVGQLLDGWKSSGAVDALELDLALERLRSAYSALRFAESLPVSSHVEPEPAAEEEPAVSAGVEISLDDVFENIPASDDILAGEADTGSEGLNAGGGVETTSVEAPSADHSPAPEEQTAAMPGPEAETMTVPATEPAPATDTTVGQDHVDTPAPETEAATAPEIAEEPAAQNTEPAREQASAEEPAPAAETLPAQESVPAADTAHVNSTEGDSHAQDTFSGRRRLSGSGSLFGDDEIIISRSPRRVVMMSLYDDEPSEPERPAYRAAAPAVSSPAEPDSLTEPAPAATMPGSLVSAERESETQPVNETVPETPEMPETPETASTQPTDNAAAAEGESAVRDAQPDGGDADTDTAAPAPDTSVPASDPVKAEPDNAGLRPYSVPSIDIAAALHDGEPVLGEVINNDVRTVADTISPVRNVASEIARKERIDDIAGALGVNDRYLLIRDLFKGDAVAYEAAIARLNGFDNLDDCMIYIVETYDWNPNSDGAKLLMDLVERKYS